jgi:hypothetical protein
VNAALNAQGVSMLTEEPEDFKELCEKVGLALLLGQKVQFALAHYYSVYHIVNSGWSKEQAKDSVNFHLSKPMGRVVLSIKNDAPLNDELFEVIDAFKISRNWLVHDFDEESTPYLSKGERFRYYIEAMEQNCRNAGTLMNRLNEVGEQLVPVGT